MKLSVLPWISRLKKTGSNEPQVFTDHVRALSSGKPLDPRQLESVWLTLGAALRRELKRRGVWESSPAYLGVFGGDTWGSSGGRKSSEGPFEELLADCYANIFISRLRSLQAQLEVKPDIGGLVIINIRHFLYERQREHDPLGFQVFQVLQSAVRLSVEEKEIRVLAGDERVRNDTVLGFSGEPESPGRSPVDLAPLVARWNDELLPDLITSRGRKQEEVVRRLRERLPDLLREGVITFRFKDLVDPLKADARARWTAILDFDQGEPALQIEGEEVKTVVRSVGPDTGIEEKQLFFKLIECVLKCIECLDVNEKTRGYLSMLWQFLRVKASEGLETEPATRLGCALAAEVATEDEERPSLRKLAEQLRIPRERLPGLFETLGSLLEQCRAAMSGRTAVVPLAGDFSHGSRD